MGFFVCGMMCRFVLAMKKPFLIILPLLLIFGCSPKPKDFKSLLIGKWKRENSQDTLEIKKDGTLEVIEHKVEGPKKHQGVWTPYEEKKEVTMILSAILPVKMDIIELNDKILHCKMVTNMMGEESIEEIRYFRL